MHSDFVVSFRKIRWKREDFPDANDVLFQHYCQMQRMLKRNALTEPQLLKQFAHNTLNEIDVEETRIREKAEGVQNNLKQTIARKNDQNILSAADLKEADYYEGELNYFADILTTIEDAKATLLEYLAAYYPEEIVKNEKVLGQLRKYLPVYNLYRQKIENLAINEYFQTSSPTRIPFPQLSNEEQASQIIGRLNFEKACTSFVKE